MKFVNTADTHLGFDITKIPQADSKGRSRRSETIFENFKRVIQHAIDIEADLFMHSGDLFNKYYIPGEVLDELVLRFNLTGGSRVRDYPDLDFEKIRAKLLPILECRFSIKIKNLF